jgi:hypothetical protein
MSYSLLHSSYQSFDVGFTPYKKIKKKNERRAADNFLLNKAKAKMFAVSHDTEAFLC